MTGLFEAAHRLQEFLEENRSRFCFIGGLALQRFGENRLTTDIDATLLTEFGEEENAFERLLTRYRPRRKDARAFALRYRIALLVTEEGIGVDIAFGGLPFDKEMVDRATIFEFLPGCALRTCTAEDLVVFKAFVGRPQDWVDIRGILVRQSENLDYASVEARLNPLCRLKEEPEILERLGHLRLSVLPAR